MINLAAAAPIIIPFYTGGGIDFTSLPVWGLIILIIVILLIMALLGIIFYQMNKCEFGEGSLGWDFRVLTIIMDLLTIIVGFGGCGYVIYSCIIEILNK